MTDPFWATAGKTYKKVSRNALVLWSEQPENWDYIAAFAAKHRLETNSLYFARGDIKKYEELNKKLLLINQSNNFDKDTLYILNDPEAMMISRNVNLNKHLLSRFNGFWVLAPYWHEYTDDKTLQFIPKIEKDRPLEFGSGKPGALFLGGINQGEYHRFGWSLPEGWGTWSDGNSARLILPIPISPNIDTLSINANIIFGENEQVFEIFQMDRIRGESDSGVKLGRYVFNRPAGKSTSIVKIVIPLTPKMKEEGIVNLKLNFSKPIQPKEIWGGDDSRNLSVGLISATYH